MGDRTYYCVSIDSTSIPEEEIKELAELIEFDDFDFGANIRITADEHSCGCADEVAQAVLKWMREKPKERLGSFSVQEDPQYEWLGQLVSYDTATDALHSVECDGSGNPLINEAQLERLWKKGGGPADIAAALEEYFGPGSDFPAPKAIGLWPDREDAESMIDFHLWKLAITNEDTTLGFRDWHAQQKQEED